MGAVVETLDALRSRGLLRPRRLVEFSQDSLGFFVRLPQDVAAQFPPPAERGGDDASPPHVT